MGVMARICNNCAFGKRDKCVKCGEPLDNDVVIAQYCEECGVGRGSDQCIRCKKQLKGQGIMARVCKSCGSKCITCGKQM